MGVGGLGDLWGHDCVRCDLRCRLVATSRVLCVDATVVWSPCSGPGWLR